MLITVNGVNIYYEVHGNDSNRALILLHGNGEDHHILDEAVELLRKKYCVYAIDTRGHGQSSPITEFHYDDFMEDLYQFIMELGLKTPIVYGFSDGGIIGLLLAAKYPQLLSALVVSGANTRPQGLKKGWLRWFRLTYFFKRKPLYKLMLEEPDITQQMLQKIQVPTFITAGSNDLIRDEETQKIHQNIKGSTLKIFEGEDHGSYIVHNEKIGSYLLEVLNVMN